ncbi:SRPBCC family protein [Tenacibaculum aestuariivivum]|uniref:SRPBCC family protein n=1 Tax=Tenacibaculum aestuariivivum TaxID=2006131 RepID=UPI003AB1AF64
MPVIKIETIINPPLEIVFDLSRSIDLHKISAEKTKEEAISGKVSGLINTGETVTWKAKYFGFYQKLTVKITELDFPNYFSDEMVKGVFNSFTHKHEFKKIDGNTLMTDYFNYKSPYEFLGRIINKIFLENYMKNFLLERNQIIKEFSETDKWKLVLKN